MTDLPVLREKILRIVEHSPDDDGAYIQAADLLREVPLHSLPPIRLAILRSFTIEPLIESLQVKCFLEGFRLELYLSQFNQIAQEVLNKQSGLYQFNPQFILLAVRWAEGVRSGAAETISGWAESIVRNSRARLIISNFLVRTGHEPEVNIYLNGELLKIRELFPQVSIFDLDGLALRFGKGRFLDSIQMKRMSNPYRLSAYPVYAEALLSHLQTLHSPHRKCLVVDLDNTLWQGIIGEDGFNSIRPLADFQRALLKLSEQGILLAINSKNNPEEALKVLRSHPEMVLKENNFSAARINWKDKAENLREIAKELNIGLDSLVFMDDNPAECERVRQACPEVLVVPLPSDELLYYQDLGKRYSHALGNLNCFPRGPLTDEDRNRTAMYRAQAERNKLAGETGSLEDFYASLMMRGTLWRNNRSQITRIAQMTQKTNQFNLTTLRCTEEEIGQLMERAFVYSLQVEDRYGDNGIIAVAAVIPSPDGTEWAIDNFLMSCRVVMRTIEDTLLAEIAADAKEAGVKRLAGRYIPTAKNEIVKEFYPQRGFKLEPGQSSARASYLLDLAGKGTLKPSPWITLTREAEIRR